MKSHWAINKNIVAVSIIVTTTNHDCSRSCFVKNISCHLHSAGTIVMIDRHDNSVIIPNVMKKIVYYSITELSWISPVINRTHVITLCCCVMNVVELYQMIVTMQV